LDELIFVLAVTLCRTTPKAATIIGDELRAALARTAAKPPEFARLMMLLRRIEGAITMPPAERRQKDRV
jgi:hypothetical protein